MNSLNNNIYGKTGIVSFSLTFNIQTTEVLPINALAGILKWIDF